MNLFRAHRRLARDWMLVGLAMLAIFAAKRDRAIAELPQVETSRLIQTPSFQNDVMQVLGKAGCNMGACHGNASGKGGFKLSLRGQDPSTDYKTITQHNFGRRIDQFDPSQSLLLLKATASVGHQGGKRFSTADPEFAILRDWIAAGMPGMVRNEPKLVALEVSPREQIMFAPADRLQLSAKATYSNGTTRDVTRLAIYEPSGTSVIVSAGGLVQRGQDGEVTVLVRLLDRQVPVRIAFLPARPDFAWRGPKPVNYIDEQVFAKLKAFRQNPAELCDDRTFIRRASLDLLGLLPTPDEVRAFIADKSADKRAMLVDKLLARPEFAEHWALKWSDILRNEEKVLDAKGSEKFHGWIRDSFAANKSLDKFVREMILARGSTYENPPANYWRANRDAVTRGETTAQVFLGTRLQCAKCHNHPFDRWTQDNYYEWSAIFARIEYKIVANERRDKLDKHEFNGDQIVQIGSKSEVQNPDTGKNAVPRVLADSDTSVKPIDPQADRLAALADWLTSPDNREFAQAQANRIWFHLMGRGLVDPVDDFRATNPASHPALIEALGDDFRQQGYDVRKLIRTIMASRSYQLASTDKHATGKDWAAVDDSQNYARAIIRRLSAEQLLDAQCQTLGVSAKFADYPAGTRAGQLTGVKRRRDGEFGDKFLEKFGKPLRLLACDCERTSDSSLVHALAMIAGPTIDELLSDGKSRLVDLADGDTPFEKAVTELYWHGLARAPSDEELTAAANLLTTSPSRLTALQDVAWAIVNAKEFVFRW